MCNSWWLESKCWKLDTCLDIYYLLRTFSLGLRRFIRVSLNPLTPLAFWIQILSEIAHRTNWDFGWFCLGRFLLLRDFNLTPRYTDNCIKLKTSTVLLLTRQTDDEEARLVEQEEFEVQLLKLKLSKQPTYLTNGLSNPWRSHYA